ncbi:hypothetical protein HYT52_04310 [Candidatus Woesearchaeota archaeon]|nr:hypothetical protein [Candidatus Woesearchaeota archaeon]
MAFSRHSWQQSPEEDEEDEEQEVMNREIMNSNRMLEIILLIARDKKNNYNNLSIGLFLSGLFLFRYSWLYDSC